MKILANGLQEVMPIRIRDNSVRHTVTVCHNINDEKDVIILQQWRSGQSFELRMQIGPLLEPTFIASINDAYDHRKEAPVVSIKEDKQLVKVSV